MATSKRPLTSKIIAKYIAGFASDKKAEDIVILDMRKVANYCDYFVICSASSDRRIRAIADGIDEGLTKKGIRIRYRPVPGNTWLVLDAGDVIVHIFDAAIREFYNLEHLWQDARRVDLKK